MPTKSVPGAPRARKIVQSERSSLICFPSTAIYTGDRESGSLKTIRASWLVKDVSSMTPNGEKDTRCFIFYVFLSTLTDDGRRRGRAK